MYFFFFFFCLLKFLAGSVSILLLITSYLTPFLNAANVLQVKKKKKKVHFTISSPSQVKLEEKNLLRKSLQIPGCGRPAVTVWNEVKLYVPVTLKYTRGTV